MPKVSAERVQRAKRRAWEQADTPETTTPEELWRELSRASRNRILAETPKRVHPSEMVFPRTSDIFSSDELTLLLDKLGDDASLILPKLRGLKVDTYYGVIGTIEPFGRGMFGIRVRLHCAKCVHPKRTATVYLCGGPHHGAWCYAYSRAGAFLADLRDQEYVCAEHAAK